MLLRDIETIRQENAQLVEAIVRLETAALEEQRKGKRREKLFKLLQLLHHQISQAQDSQTICQLTVQFLVEKIEFNRAIIFQQVDATAVPIAAWGYVDRAHHPSHNGLILEWIQTAQSLIINGQTATDKGFPWEIQGLSESLEVKYFLSLPFGLPSRDRYLLIIGNQSEATFKHPTLTSSDHEIFQTLANQIAISIHQAELYTAVATAKVSAEAQSQELQQTLQHLQHTQAQVIQAEKMSALGNLVAGVAHEINNPIGFLNGSIHNAIDYAQSLLAHIELYQQHLPQPPTPILDNAAAIDFGFLAADFPRLLTSMMGAVDRIAGISTSLRTFSRADTEHKVSANLHEGLDSTILILKYRLKANEYRPAIEVVQAYGDIPLLDCFPGQINQVFMNILANAIDALDEMAQTDSFSANANKAQKIVITTAIVEQQIEIRIADNGQGMPETVRQRIFDHLYTTKAVGKGTGLGLAIAHQIIVEKHGGNITVNSTIGQGTEFIIDLPVCGVADANTP
jgi:signal transduction histidine kinase